MIRQTFKVQAKGSNPSQFFSCPIL